MFVRVEDAHQCAAEPARLAGAKHAARCTRLRDGGACILGLAATRFPEFTDGEVADDCG